MGCRDQTGDVNFLFLSFFFVRPTAFSLAINYNYYNTLTCLSLCHLRNCLCQVQCFLHHKFLNRTKQKNSLKRKTAYKVNENIRFMFSSTFVKGAVRK